MAAARALRAESRSGGAGRAARARYARGVLTLRSAASLLAAAHDLERLVPIAAALGFTARPLPLDDRARDALGLGVDVGAAAVVRGPGALRALLLETRSQAPLRDVVRALGARIATRAPHLLWLLVVADRAGDGVALAAWSGDRKPGSEK